MSPSIRNWIVTLLVLAASISVAAESVPIYVDGQASDEDRVGQNLIFALKDQLRGSHSFALFDAPPDTPAIWLRILTVKSTDYSSAYSAVFTFDNPSISLFMYNMVGICGEQRIDTQARSLVRQADELATKYGMRK